MQQPPLRQRSLKKLLPPSEVTPGSPVPRLSVKAAFYFSDLTERGRGQTWVIPGTHKLGADQPRPAAQNGESGTRQPVGAIPLLVPPNSCVLFDRRLLHASSPNWSEHERKVVFYVREIPFRARAFVSLTERAVAFRRALATAGCGQRT